MRILDPILKIFFVVFLLLLLNLQNSAATDKQEIFLRGDTLSVTAEKIPLQTLLLELAKQDITVRIDPQINPPVTVNFENRPVEQGLESLLKSVSYSLIWESVRDDAGNGAVRLAEIQVFQSGRKHLMQQLRLPGKVQILKTGEGRYYVKDEILLYLPEGFDRQKLEKLLREYGATLVATNNSLTGPVKILLPANSDVFILAREIKNRLNIEIAQPNYAYPLETPEFYPLVSGRVDTEAAPHTPATNSVPIAILDSGLAENDVLNRFVISSLDVLHPDTHITDTLGHGTQMAYIASGLVKPYGSDPESDSYVPIIPIRAFDDDGYTTDFNIMNSVNFALANNARVMSLSWGSENKSDFMEKTFADATARGLVVVASAGNEPTGKPVYPAAYPAVIGVGALEPHGKTWESSNYGNFVTLYAPGFATLPIGHKGDPGMYAGTSIATALVANSIAGYLSENPAATEQEIQDYLKSKFK